MVRGSCWFFPATSARLRMMSETIIQHKQQSCSTYRQHEQSLWLCQRKGEKKQQHKHLFREVTRKVKRGRVNQPGGCLNGNRQRIHTYKIIRSGSKEWQPLSSFGSREHCFLVEHRKPKKPEKNKKCESRQMR